MSEYPYPPYQGSSAPVAIVLALALAATVGVSARSWDVQPAPTPPSGAARPAGGAVAAPEDGDGASLLRWLLPDWARRGVAVDCSASPR